MSASDKRGIIFDLDGTLYYMRKTRVRLALVHWRSVGIIRHIGKARTALRGQTFASGDELRSALAEELAVRAKITPVEASNWYMNIFYPNFVALLQRRALARPGLYPLLSKLRRRGVKLGIVSDFSRAEERVRAIGLPPEAFDDIESSEDLGQLKPLPHGFLHLAERWGLESSEVLAVGDRVDRDAGSARAAGMESVIIDNHPPKRGHREEDGKPIYSWADVVRQISAHAGLEQY